MLNKEEIGELDDKLDEMLYDDFLDTDEVLDQVNELARLFYANLGYQIRKGYDFESASHPQERTMFAHALIAFNYVRSISNKAEAELRREI